MITIIHNPRCSKSNQTLDLLKQKGVNPQIRLYLENKLSKQELQEIIQKLDISPIDLLRKGEDEFKQLIKKEGSVSNQSAIEWMLNHPKLIQRPIVINDNKAKIGRPPESVLEIL